jgi:probable F420-dependent oxidoreductase
VTIEVGIRIPYQGDVAVSDILTVVREAEAAGLQSGWVGDHLAFPEKVTSAMPRSSSLPSRTNGTYPWPMDAARLDSLTTLAFVAASSRTLRIGVGVLIAALRGPAVVAKAAATLDYLSGGRLILGLGLGWLREEFDMAGRDFGLRRAYLEETVEVCRALWEQNHPSFHGKTADFGPVHFGPRPIQEPLPIVLGGSTPAALQRAGRVGDGWMGSHQTPEEIAAHRTVLLDARAAGSRAYPPFTMINTRVIDTGTGYQLDGMLPPDPVLLADLLGHYEQAGLGVLVLDAASHNADHLLQVIDVIVRARQLA